MKLTKRETVLLYALAFVVLNLVAFAFVISPLYQKYLIVKLNADTVELDLQSKLNTTKLTGPLLLNARKLDEKIKLTKDQQVTQFYADEIDEYLYYAISPFVNEWTSMTIGTYMPFDGFDGSVLSHTQRAEVKIEMNASENVMMQVMREFQNNDKLIGIRDIEVEQTTDGTKVNFVIDFYLIQFENE